VYETEPLPELVVAAEDHLAVDDHDLTGAELAEYFPDHRGASETPVITYLPESRAAPAHYTCSRCPGRTFYPVAPTYGHPARNAELLRTTPGLREKTLGLTPKQAAIVIENWDRRRATQGKDELEEVLKRQGRATKRAGRPEVEARIARCQDYLLDAWERLGSQEAAIRELIALAEVDRSAHDRIVGRRYPMASHTYHQYLGKASPERRAEVRARIRGR
jgi:hypothetical protein